MKRRVALNLALAAVAAYCAWALRLKWQTAEARLEAIVRAPSAVKAVRAPARPRSGDTLPRPAEFFEVAEKFLFSKDRNPTVVAEVQVAKPMPPLPFAYGVMDLGSGPVAFLAFKGEGQRGYKLGETVGSFKLTEATATELAFEWEGKTVRRRLEELRADPKDVAMPAEAARPSAPAASTVTNLSNPAPASASAVSNVAGTPPPQGKAALGAQSGTLRYCVPGDANPEGAVVDGYKKVSSSTPFGKVCFWEPVK